MSRAKVFISYSHEDREWKNQLLKHFVALQREIDPWTDDRIDAGDDWYERIEAALSEADAAVALVSVDFLGSKFALQEEIERLLERRRSEGLSIFPILIRHCPYDRIPWLKPLEIRPDDLQPVDGRDRTEQERLFALFAAEVANLLSGPSEAGSSGKARSRPRVDRAAYRRARPAPDPPGAAASLAEHVIEIAMRRSPRFAKKMHQLSRKYLGTGRSKSGPDDTTEPGHRGRGDDPPVAR